MSYKHPDTPPSDLPKDWLSIFELQVDGSFLSGMTARALRAEIQRVVGANNEEPEETKHKTTALLAKVLVANECLENRTYVCVPEPAQTLDPFQAFYSSWRALRDATSRFHLSPNPEGVEIVGAHLLATTYTLEGRGLAIDKCAGKDMIDALRDFELDRYILESQFADIISADKAIGDLTEHS